MLDAALLWPYGLPKLGHRLIEMRFIELMVAYALFAVVSSI